MNLCKLQMSVAVSWTVPMGTKLIFYTLQSIMNIIHSQKQQ